MSRRVLYVDDEVPNLTVFEACFGEQFEVFTATSGEEALAFLERTPVPVVIADQRMPRMTGVELFETLLRRAPWTKRVLVTGYTDPEAFVDAINKGRVYHYVSKPWDETELYNVLVRAFEAHELERSHAALTDRLVLADRCATLGRMSARIAHEIGNNLCVVPLLETLEEDHDEPELRASIGLAREALGRITALVREVKRFARVGVETCDVHPEPLADLVHELVSFVRHDAALHSRRIRVVERGNPVVLADRIRLQQVLLNLVRNAGDAIRSRDDGLIVVRVERSDGNGLLVVEDNGEGIDPADVERIWEPFYTSKGDEGTGLGLDVSRRIVENHGGRIHCEPLPERGTRFVVEIPLAEPTGRHRLGDSPLRIERVPARHSGASNVGG